MTNKSKVNILQTITPQEALGILKLLAQSDPIIASRIEKLAMRALKTVNTENIAADVSNSLSSIDVEELWDRSGSTRYGYTDPLDEAVVMVGEVLEPFIGELNRLLDLELLVEAKDCCKGILQGLYHFSNNEKTEFQDWAVDLFEDSFAMILKDWEKKCSNEDAQEMTLFIQQQCPNWAR